MAASIVTHEEQGASRSRLARIGQRGRAFRASRRQEPSFQTFAHGAAITSSIR